MAALPGLGIGRLFGFNVFRNTYKPLLAESLVAFCGRYYYFKELLVNFFFLPTFAQSGKRRRQWPNLRLFAAVIAAAFFGNILYPCLKDVTVFDGYIPWSRTFYCFQRAMCRGGVKSGVSAVKYGPDGLGVC